MRTARLSWALLVVSVLLFTLVIPRPALGAEATASLYIRVQTAGGAAIGEKSVNVTDLKSQMGLVYPRFMNDQVPFTLEAGTHKVRVSALGYEPAADQLVTLSPGQTETVTFVLKQAANPGRVTGRLTEADGRQALAGLDVALLRDGQFAGPPVTTGYDGTYTFPLVAPGEYTLSANGWRIGLSVEYVTEQRTVTVHPDETVTMDFALVRMGRIVADIRTDGGGTATDAEIVISAAGRAPAIFTRDLNGEVGGSLTPGLYTVVAQGNGYAAAPPQAVTIHAGETSRLSFVLTKLPSGSIRGKVTDNHGAPVSFAVVEILGEKQRPAARTNSDGVFVLENVAVGTYKLFASPPAGIRVLWPGMPDPVNARQVEVIAGQTATVDLQVLRPVLVKARVVDAAGRPIPGGQVIRPGAWPTPERTPDGTLLLSVDEGELTIAAEAPGYMPTDYRTVHVGAPGDPETITFTLQSGSIRGRVSDAGTGAPVSGLTVHVRGEYGGGDVAPAVTTDAEGAFAFPTVPVGRLEVLTSGDGYRADLRTVTVQDGQTTAVDLAPQSFGYIEVRVVDEAGKPVSGASVVTMLPGRNPEFQIANTEGIMRAQLDSGVYSVTARSANHRSLSPQTVQIAPGKTATVTLAVRRSETGTVLGQVVGAETDKGLLGVTAYLKDLASGATVNEPVMSDGNGVLQFPEVPVGQYEVMIQDGKLLHSAQPVRVTVTRGETARFLLAGRPGQPLQYAAAGSVHTGTPPRVGEQPLIIPGRGWQAVRLEAPVAGDRDLLAWYLDEKLGAWIAVPTAHDGVTVTARLPLGSLVRVAWSGAVRQFSDTHSHWAAADIMKLQSLGVLSGYPDGSFRPDESLTRYQVAKAITTLRPAAEGAADLTVLEGLPDGDSVSDWARPSVAMAVAAGYIIPGAGGFQGDQLVTRAEMAAIVARLLPEQAGGAPSFADGDAIPADLRAGVARTVAAGVMTGYPDGRFGPEEPLTRAEMATILSRLVSVLDQ